MKNTTKILVGVGVVALAYYLFKDKFKSTTSKKGDANFSNLTTSGGGRSCIHLYCPCGCRNDKNGRGHCTPPSLCPK